MRTCGYQNCSKSIGDNPRKKYCSNSHRVRQWELTNNKPNFVEKPKISAKKVKRSLALPNQLNQSEGHRQSKAVLYGILGGIIGKFAGNNTTALLGGVLGFIHGRSQDKKPAVYFVQTNQPIPSIAQIEDKFDKLEKGDVVSSEDYRKAIIPSIEVSEKYNYLFGNPAPNFYMVVTGEAGHGKSTFATQFAEYFNLNHGKALYLASEQSGANLALQELFKRYNTSFDIHTKPKSLKGSELVKLISKYKLVVIDSANHMRINSEQIELLRENAKETAFVVILQNKKDGHFKGSNEWKHNCDVFIKCEKLVAKSQKTRYGKLGEVPIIG